MFELISHEIKKKYKIDAILYKEKLIELFLKKDNDRIFDKALMEFISKIPSDWESFVKITILKIYRRAEIKINLWTEAISVLNKLKRSNIILSLITNGNVEVQKNKIRLLKLEKIFDKIYISDSYKPPQKKPSTKMFEDFLKDFNLNTNEVVHIGDDERLDGVVENLNIKFYKINSKDDWSKFLNIIEL